MKHVLACTLILLFAGCGGKPNDSSADGSAIVQNSDIDNAEQSPGNTDEATPNEQALAASLEKLMQSARELESRGEFQQAAQVWAQIVDALTTEFGPDAWQAANARLAYQTAMMQNQFDAQQSAALSKIADLQRQMNAAAKQNETRIAAGLASQSVQQSSQLFGPTSAITAKQRVQYAKLLKSLSKSADAVYQFEQALTDLSKNFAAIHPDVCHLHDYLGDLYLNGANYATAINHLNAATRMSAAIWGDDSPQYATRANQLGVAYYRSGQQEIALRVLQAAEVIRRRKLGENDIQVGHSLSNIGNVLIQLRRPADAIVQLEKAQKIFASHENLAKQYDQVADKLATAFMLNGQPDKAEPLLAHLLKKAQSTLPEYHPDLAATQYRYAIALGRQGKYELAEPVIQAAITANQTNYGPQHSETIRSYQAYAMLLERTNRKQDAQKLMDQLRVAQNPGSNSFQR